MGYKMKGPTFFNKLKSPLKVDLTKKEGFGPREKAFLTEEEKNIVKHEQTKYKDFENPVTRERSFYSQTEKERQ
jgi:hypothetical protein